MSMKVRLDYGDTYNCDIAYRGSDYARLALNDGTIVASFEGVVDFSVFTFYNASGSVIDPAWTSVPDIFGTKDCHMAVVKRDGTVLASDIGYMDIKRHRRFNLPLSSDVANWNKVSDGGTTSYYAVYVVADLNESDVVTIEDYNVYGNGEYCQVYFDAYVDPAYSPIVSEIPKADLTGSGTLGILIIASAVPREDVAITVEICNTIGIQDTLTMSKFPK